MIDSNFKFYKQVTDNPDFAGDFLGWLSQAGLARLAGVGKTVIFDLKHGKQTVQLDTLKKVLAALNIRLELHSPVLERMAKQATTEPLI